MRLVLVVSAIILIACGGEESGGTRPDTEDPPELIVESVTDVTSPGALLAGHLVVEQGCLLIVTSNGERYLTVWPTGTVLNASSSTVVLSEGIEVPIDETDRTFSGGSMEGLESASDCASRLQVDSLWVMAREPLD